jgi:peptidyl-prolyl cis-trans isomerase D
VKSQGGKTLAQAHDEIAAKLDIDKRKTGIEDLVDKIQNAIDDGQNFTEAAATAKVPVTTTPLITAAGTSRTDPSFRLSPDLAPALKAGFEIAPNDPPEIVSLNEKGYVLVSPAEVTPAAPAPLASIRDKVAADWLNDQAAKRARAAADRVTAAASKGASLADALKQAGVPLPPARPIAARRIQLATANGQIPPPLRLLFTIGQGTSRSIPDPQGRGIYVVKVNKIVPGNALLQPALIGQMQQELQQTMSEDYARQFIAAIRADLKAKQHDSSIQAMKARLASGGS